MLTDAQKKGSSKIAEAVKYTTGDGSSSNGKGSRQRTYGANFSSEMERIQSGESPEQVQCLECEVTLDVDNVIGTDRECICGAVLFTTKGKPTKKARLL